MTPFRNVYCMKHIKCTSKYDTVNVSYLRSDDKPFSFAGVCFLRQDGAYSRTSIRSEKRLPVHKREAFLLSPLELAVQ